MATRQKIDEHDIRDGIQILRWKDKMMEKFSQTVLSGACWDECAVTQWSVPDKRISEPKLYMPIFQMNGHLTNQHTHTHTFWSALEREPSNP